MAGSTVISGGLRRTLTGFTLVVLVLVYLAAVRRTGALDNL